MFEGQILAHCHSDTKPHFLFLFYIIEVINHMYVIMVPNSQKMLSRKFQSWIIYLIVPLWCLFGLDVHLVFQLQMRKFRSRLWRSDGKVDIIRLNLNLMTFCYLGYVATAAGLQRSSPTVPWNWMKHVCRLLPCIITASWWLIFNTSL